MRTSKCVSGGRNCSPTSSGILQQSDQPSTVRNSGVKKTSWRGEATRPTASSSSWSPPPPDTTEFSLAHSPISLNSPPISSSLPQQQQVAQTFQTPQPVGSSPLQTAPAAAASPSHSSVSTDLNTLTIAQLLELLKQKPTAAAATPTPTVTHVVREPQQQTVRADRVIASPPREFELPQAQHHSSSSSSAAIDSPSVYFNSDQMRRHLATSLQIPAPQQSSSHLQHDVPHSRTFTAYRAQQLPLPVTGARHSAPFQPPSQSSRTRDISTPSLIRRPPGQTGPAPSFTPEISHHTGGFSSRIPTTQLPTQAHHQASHLQPDLIRHSDRSRITISPSSLHSPPFLNPSQVGLQ